jgi:ubiquinol-cytochrome c reductase cytochrome c1 subunit
MLLDSIRRGFEVYRQVCSTCHGMEFFSFRHLVGVSHSKEQAQALAESFQIKDGPDDKGDFFERPGTSSTIRHHRLPLLSLSSLYHDSINV